MPQFCICPVLPCSMLYSADCSTVEIPSDEFLHFSMDCCLLEVRATLAELAPERQTGFTNFRVACRLPSYTRVGLSNA